MRVLTLIAFLGLAACVGDGPVGPDEWDACEASGRVVVGDGKGGSICRARELPRSEAAECVARGGRVSTAGLLGYEYCYVPPGDMGKACSRRSDCERECLAETRQCGDPGASGASVLDDLGRVEQMPIE